MDDSGSSDSWNKLGKANKKDEIVKPEHIDVEAEETTRGFCLNYDPFSDISSCTKADAEMAEDDRQHFLSEAGKKQLNEAPDHRAQRLAKMSAYAAQRLANESPEQRAVRLKRMSEYAAKRLANETSEQRAKRLSRMSAYAAKRLAKETPEQRQERLTRMSAYAARRHAIKKMHIVAEKVTMQIISDSASSGESSTNTSN